MVLPRIAYTATEAAQVTGWSLRKITYAIKDGSLPSTFAKGRRRIKAEDLEHFAMTGGEPRSNRVTDGDSIEHPSAGLQRYIGAR